MSEYDIWPQFECQNRILNVKILYFASVSMSKYDTRPNFDVKNRKTKNKKRKAKNKYEK